MSCKTLTPESIMNGALALIGRPPALAAKLGDLYDIMANVLEPYQNILDIHGGNFLLKNVSVTLAANALTATATLPNFGRPVSCDLDPASIPLGALLPRRDVDLVPLQNLDLYRSTVAPMSNTGVVTPTGSTVYLLAQAMAWNREPANVIRFYFEFGGVTPTVQGIYRIFYEGGGISEVEIGTEIDWMPNFIGLLQQDCALAFLPHSEIDEPKYSRFERDFSRRVEKREALLHQWLQNDHVEQTGYVGGYARTKRTGARFSST